MGHDILSDVLQAVRLKGAVFYLVEAAEPWVVMAPPSREVAAAVMPGCDHVMEFHVFFEGECWGGPLGGGQERIGPGEVVLFPRGEAHLFRSDPGLSPPPPTMPQEGALPIRLRYGGTGPPSARFVCGFLGCDARPFNPLIEALPRMLRIPAREGPMGELIRLAVAETAVPRAGGEALRARLAEMMFVEAVRTHLAALPEGSGGWLGGLRDPQVGRALGLLHGRPAHPWTLDDLAREAGLSRTALHERFAALVGRPPMQYLTHWRMQLAATRLAQGGDKVVSIAVEVGYESEAAFNRAFKRLVGMPPAAWRRERASRA
ncbi:AraC family transcriptional regulator [Roseomonas populi]|uniref:AraC family transcriptional regulator n=1 Tax=Roseomonas populi TaxID=3121582 RepID=A0ABT1X2X2_9PROT|nr:AraC family transcriptional regulator [Roseomonas pecuniae]MCR0981319.1 AraC family transcriptional regulator [Roseomonas pecuniae]